MLKKKVLELKQVASRQRKELADKEATLEKAKTNYETALETVQRDLHQVKDMWERRCTELQLDAQSKLSQTIRSHKVQVAQLQQHYQSLLDSKIHEFEEETSELNKRHKTLELSMHQEFQERLTGYVTKDQHERLLQEALAALRTSSAKNGVN